MLPRDGVLAFDVGARTLQMTCGELAVAGRLGLAIPSVDAAYYSDTVYG